MSFSRRNWSDLSSLARQRTLEDEEEQQRERRRRHRNLLSSTSTDEEPASPVKDTSPAASRSPSLLKPQSLEDGEEQKPSEVLNAQEGRRTRCLPPVCEKLRQEKEAGVEESCPERGPQPWGKQESSRAAERAQEAAKGRGDLPGDKNLEPASERKVVVRARLQDKDQGVWTPRGEQRKEAKEPPEVGSCRLREVKILTRVGNCSTEEKTSAVTSSPEQQQPSRNPSKQVIQLSPPQDEPAEKPDPSSTHVTFSSSIRRASPRTVSFRIISRNQKESQSPLTRSASLRIPGSNSTIGEKLEKYNSAVQRSEGVKSSVPVQKSRLLSSEGVASKRNFFEGSAPSKAEPAALRKDSLKIPGSVTSRINLWISRAQEPAKEENSKEIRRINSLAKRDIWIKQPGDTSGDTKCSIPSSEQRLREPGRSCLAGSAPALVTALPYQRPGPEPFPDPAGSPRSPAAPALSTLMGAQVARVDFGCPGSREVSQIPVPCSSAGDRRDVTPTASLALDLWQPRGWVSGGMLLYPVKQDWSRDMTHFWSKRWERRAPRLGSLEESRGLTQPEICEQPALS
ncbi:ladinin-1 [Cinclus cinclus]|uniref:ladinin-1 n=1 Tax=Cinclus cinclus TaxID=127875 RepID=UPI002E167653